MFRYPAEGSSGKTNIKEIRSKMYGEIISSIGLPLCVSGISRRVSIVVLIIASDYDNKFNDNPT